MLRNWVSVPLRLGSCCKFEKVYVTLPGNHHWIKFCPSTRLESVETKEKNKSELFYKKYW